MRTPQKIATVVLLGCLGAAIYGIVRASESADKAASKASKANAAEVVDQSALRTARQLAALADSPEEQTIAKEALRLGDYELDLAFDIALRDANAHPAELSDEAKAIQLRLQKAQKLQQALVAQVAQLNAEVAKASGDRKQELDDQLSLTKSSLDLANNEVDDAEGDLSNAGGNQRGRIEQLKQAHEAAGHGKEEEKSLPQPSAEELGLIHRYKQWWALRGRKTLLAKAKADADSAAAGAAEQHAALEAQIEAEKFNSPDLAAHSSLSGTEATAAAPEAVAGSVAKNVRRSRSHAESKEALAVTRAIAEDQQSLSSLDKRADHEKELSELYAQWMSLVSVRQSNVMKQMLTGVAIILGVLLVGVFFNTWMEKLLGKLKLDRRQVQTLRAVTRVTLQVLAVILVLLVIFGLPSQLGTFLGLAGAGLTVALKDFIVGFIGWFVLMGRNGIRLGDWVEINGVTGEVVEIGMFHTVLLETGNWTDSGHPTGRRVTFMNSYAIEGHYFNFSTSGQWLWDELQITIPEGRDPFPLVDAIQKKVLEATQDSAKQAELEWARAAGSRELSSITAAPAINVRPAAGGVEVQVRYVTRASERYQMRTRLYQTAVELLGGRDVHVSAPKDPEPKPA
jgi:small-conductance mechanosensitive channel